MTIIVGLEAKDGVVVASDSQAGTWRGVDVKRLDYTKIHCFDIDARFHVVLTGAGSGAFLTKAADKFRDKCRVQHPNTIDEASDLAEDVITELMKRYMVDRAKQLGYVEGHDQPPLSRRPGAGPQLQIDDLQIILMLGIAGTGKKAIYIIHSQGVAERVQRYASVGSGSPFAEYLLARLCPVEPTLEEAIDLAAYVVEEVKKIDPHCGGRTQVVFVTKDKVERIKDNSLDDRLDQIAQRDSTMSRMWRAMVTDTIKPNTLESLVALLGEDAPDGESKGRKKNG